MSEASRPLTVLFLDPVGGEGWGGAERWLLDVARGLRARGHAVLSVGRPGSAWTTRCLAEKFETRTTEMRGDLNIGEARAVAFWLRELIEWSPAGRNAFHVRTPADAALFHVVDALPASLAGRAARPWLSDIGSHVRGARPAAAFQPTTPRRAAG